MQEARTSQLVFSITGVVTHLASILTLLPDGVVFTGIPSGIGFVRDPMVLLKPGDVLGAEVEGIDRMRQTFVERPIAGGTSASRCQQNC
jgi:2-keto-4-pentenoate hydratase/2-oxohepta-3-ene-1,7-dioic acid hydratase in catechol pathway